MIPANLLHYLDDNDYNQVIYNCKGEDVIPRLEKALKEAAAVKDLMADESWHGFAEYQLLIHVLAEQSTVTPDGTPQKKNYAVHVSANMASRAQYMKKLSTDEYMQLTRKRNAIEGIMSVLRRKYRIDEIPIFGYLRSRQFFLFKIGAYNFKKLVSHNRRLRVESAQKLKIA